MELDEFKQAWQTLNHRLDQQHTLDLLDLRERKLDKTRGSLRPLFWGQVAQIVLFGVPLLILVAMLWASGPRSAPVIFAGIVLNVYAIVINIAAGVVLGQIRRINYSAPVLDIQKQLLRLRTLYVRSAMIAGLPWWFLWLVVLIMFSGLAGVDLLANAPGLVWGGLGVGVIGLLTTLWMHRWSQRPQRAELRKRVDAHLTGDSLRNAQAQLEELARFEKE